MVASRILMVDDEPDLKPLILSRMRRDIRAGRYEFIFAEDGVEAVQILSNDSEIDIIVTDINMPRMDGLTLLGEISEIKLEYRVRCRVGVRGHAEDTNSD